MNWNINISSPYISNYFRLMEFEYFNCMYINVVDRNINVKDINIKICLN